jgi:hypothetical protein
MTEMRLYDIRVTAERIEGRSVCGLAESLVTGTFSSYARPSWRRTRTPTWSAGSAPSATKCLDRLRILGRRQLEHVPRVYDTHYNRQRPHRALDLKPPDTSRPSSVAATSPPQPRRIERRDLLGGLIHEYELAA